MNFLKKMIGSNASSLSFSIGKEKQMNQNNYWRLHEGKRNSDGEEVTVFLLDKSSVPADLLELARHSFQNCPKYHHPYLLKYLDGDEMESQLVYCTEMVTPLLTWASNLDPQTRNDQITWGLFCLFSALKFLHEDCKVSHSNIGPHSIFVSHGGDWKVGGMDLIGNLSDSYHMGFFSRNAEQVPGVRFGGRPPEIGAQDWTGIENGPVHALDIWGVGKVVEAVYNELGAEIPSSLERYYQKMVAQSPTSRAKASKFLQAKYFKTPLVNALIFFNEIHLKEPEEKQLFFKTIEKDIDMWPKAICTHKILNYLMEDLDLAMKLASTPQQQQQAGTTPQPTILLILPLILKIAGLLDQHAFTQKISPVLESLYSISDRGIRVALLSSLESYASKLDNDIINKKIFDPVCLGFQDNSPPMREITLKSMLHLVDRLTEKNLNDKLIKYLTRLQGDPEPGIRTNVTIFLGKIVGKLSEKTRNKILVPSLVRGLRDPFPHARMASIKTIGVCALSYVDPQAIAMNLLPNISSSLIDPAEVVRQEAFKVLDQMMERLKQHSERLVIEEKERKSKETEQARMEEGNAPPSSNASSTNLGAASIGSEGWTSWALGKIATGVSGAMASGSNPGSSPTSNSGADMPLQQIPSPPSSQKSLNLADPVAESVPKTNSAPPPLQQSMNTSTENQPVSATQKPVSGMKLSAAAKIKPTSEPMSSNPKIAFNELEKEFSGKTTAANLSFSQQPSFPSQGQGHSDWDDLSNLEPAVNTPVGSKLNSNALSNPPPIKPTASKTTDVKKLAAETSKDFWDDF